MDLLLNFCTQADLIGNFRVMAAPFKSLAGDRASLVKAKLEGCTEQPASKRQCTPYEKQLAKMDGDISFVKDPSLNTYLKIYIFIYRSIHQYIYIY